MTLRDLANNDTIRGVRLLRRSAKFQAITVFYVSRSPLIHSRGLLELSGVCDNQIYRVYFLEPKLALSYVDLPRREFFANFRSDINKAALRLYKQYREERRRYWVSPEGKAEAKRRWDEWRRTSRGIFKNVIMDSFAFDSPLLAHIRKT